MQSPHRNGFEGLSVLSRKSMTWTDEEDAELLALKRHGLSTQRISVRFRRTIRAINVRLSFLRRRPASARVADVEHRSP